ncbi:hypothetical protein BH10PLA2_BH10PLA2_36230 [soil metagenome]
MKLFILPEPKGGRSITAQGEALGKFCLSDKPQGGGLNLANPVAVVAWAVNSCQAPKAISRIQ